MSAEKSDIISDTSSELKLPSIRLTGLPQSSESLISQLDNSFKNEIRIVLIGKAGAGKSTTGNILLGKEAFSAAVSPVSVTKECCRAESDIHSKKIVVIDTPGLFDTELSLEEIQKEIIRCVTMSVPGPHIFLILLQVGRLTAEEISTLDQLFDIFGKNMSRFCMIIFTRIEDLERAGSTIDRLIINGGPLLSGYIKKCSGRYFALKNPLSQKEQFQVSAILFEKINEVISKNKNKCFTNVFYTDAKDSLNMSIKKVYNSQNASNSIKTVQIENDCDKKIYEIKSQKTHLGNELEHESDIKRQLKSKREALLKSDGVDCRNLNEELRKLDLADRECDKRMSTLKREQAQSENQYEEIKTEKTHLLAMRAEEFKNELEAAAAMAISEQTKLMEPNFMKILKKQQEIQDLKTWFESGQHMSDKKMRNSFIDKEKALRKQKEEMEKQLEKKDKHLKKMMRNSMKLEDEFKRTKIKLCVLM
ncbi:GTPase IMAP family member 9-like [Mytilus edulis]|uniref:GTPase IMAP family member 9-like n=1 Tax=Mytilus edulis TaxID=6550 RepID=UPI0039F0E6DE